MNQQQAEKAYKKGYRHESERKAEKQYSCPIKQGFYDEGRFDFANMNGRKFLIAWDFSKGAGFSLDQFDRLPTSRFNMMKDEADKELE